MKDRVFETMKRRYREITELAHRASTAALDVDDSSLRIGATSFDPKLWKLSAEVKGNRIELRVASEVVISTVEVRDRLLAGKELFDGGQILSGARKIAEVKGIVDDDDEDTLLLLKQLLSRIYSEELNINFVAILETMEVAFLKSRFELSLNSLESEKQMWVYAYYCFTRLG
ncbi:hypothetical protein SELMODRAFT_419688 [Selaginella moellendorffii]|uniref:Uncharacterized protein n=1 Tax=Selaginella moellendorffii TaxID=88036 RepID=D8S9Q6_SELML|nr:hypothetical protein SELMODRAFT_419688 [Selaginella moellendorffii]